MFGLRLHGGTAILPTHGNILSKVMSTGDNFATLMTLVEVFALLSAFLSFVKKIDGDNHAVYFPLLLVLSSSKNSRAAPEQL